MADHPNIPDPVVRAQQAQGWNFVSVPDSGTDKQPGNQQSARGAAGSDRSPYGPGDPTPTDSAFGMRHQHPVSPAVLKFIELAGSSSGNAGTSGGEFPYELNGSSGGGDGSADSGGSGGSPGDHTGTGDADGSSGGDQPADGTHAPDGAADNGSSAISDGGQDADPPGGFLTYLGAAGDSGKGSGAGSPDPADSSFTAPASLDHSGVEPATDGQATLILAGAVPAADAGTETGSSGDGGTDNSAKAVAAAESGKAHTTDGESSPSDVPGDEEKPAEGKLIDEVTVKGHPALHEVEKIVSAERVPGDKLSDQNSPNDPDHVAKVVKVINAYLAATAGEGGSRADHLLRAGSLLTQDRNLDAKHSESLILRDAQRFFYGAVGPNVFSNPRTYGGLDPISETAGRGAAEADPLLADRHHRTVAGSVVSSYTPGLYEAIKSAAIGLGLEATVRANDELPASGIGGIPWHSYGEKYASPNRGNDVEAKGNAAAATVEGYRASERIDQQRQWDIGEAIGTMDW